MEGRLSKASAMSTLKKSENSCQHEFMTLSKMQPGLSFDGPAIIETPVTTVVVNPNDRAAMDEYFNIRIHLGD